MEPQKFNRKRILFGVIVAGGLLVVLLVVLWLVGRANSGILEIKGSTAGGATSQITVTISRPNTKDTKITMLPGETRSYRLGKGTVQVSASSGNVSSVDVIPITGNKTVQLTTPSGEQRSIKQLATSTQSCPFTVQGVVYSYTCSGQTTVTKHALSTAFVSTTSTLFNGQEFSGLAPYTGGLLGFTTDNRLVYLDVVAQTITPASLPASANLLIESDQPALVMPSDPALAQYGLLFSHNNKLYIMHGVTDTTGTIVSPPKTAHIAGFADNDQGIVLYTGSGSTDGDAGEGQPQTLEQQSDQKTVTPAQAYVYEYDLAGNLRGTITLPKGFMADAVYKISTGYYIAQQPDGYDFYYYSGGTFSFLYSLSNVTGWTSYKGATYMTTSAALYSFVAKTNGQFSLRSLFTSKVIAPSQVYGTPQGVMFSGITGSNDTQRINAYQLLNDKQGNAPLQTEPDYTGLQRLVDNGITSAQITDIKLALGGFAQKTNIAPRSIVIKNVNFLPRDRTSTTGNTATFTVVIDDATYDATINYDNITDLQLVLSNSTGATVYDSGMLSQISDQ